MHIARTEAQNVWRACHFLLAHWSIVSLDVEEVIGPMIFILDEVRTGLSESV